MAVYKQPKSKYWWYKFTWNGDAIRESTKQTNKRVAEQMEAAHRTTLAKGEVGIREKKPVPTLKDFAENDFLPFARSTFAAKPKTLAYYENGVNRLLAFERLAGERLDAITSDRVAEYITKRQEAKGKRGGQLQVASLNRELQVLRRMFHLAQEWGRVERALPSVKMLTGEKHRERVLTATEESIFFKGASTNAMKQYADAALLHDVATILLDCGLRPEECFRLRMENVTDGMLEIHYGKTDNARRRIPMTPRVKATLDMRLTKTAGSAWVSPAQTKSGHIEPSSLKKQHLKATAEATRILREEAKKADLQLVPFELYTLRHTCPTRWAPHMDPWTLAYLAGHRDMNITKRYVHPQEQTIRAAMDRAQVEKTGHTSGHTEQRPDLESMPVLAPSI
ncbi:MAG TPA: tyrosine-type recombinase/integrase [Bryobacteraceae bacterium]|jgi:integrase|nr:tyrosine-type recombinase/integrase [Bryobacteraceae bacterium]